MDGLEESIMANFIKPALLTLAALFVVFATTSVAAKPDKTQTLTSAPLAGDSCWCYVSNTTDREIEVNFLITDSISGIIVDHPILIPGKGFGRTGDPLAGRIAACEVSWEGQPDNIRATFCANSYLGESWEDPQSQTCLEMY